ncbi:hypothetical protein PXNS11_60254 [Stutzerimonas xanthomarina]|nr:hypothetical protein PXNS11_60254 [Stutzerimonas xanthomarina]
MLRGAEVFIDALLIFGLQAAWHGHLEWNAGILAVQGQKPSAKCGALPRGGLAGMPGGMPLGVVRCSSACAGCR